MSNLVRKMRHNQQAGDTLHIPKPVRGTASDKTANTEVSPQGNTHNELVVNLDAHKVYAELIEDIVSIQDDYDLMSIYTEDAGFQLAKAVDTDLHQTAQNWEATGSTNNDADFTGTNALVGDGSTWDDTANSNTGNGVQFTDEGIREVIKVLDENDVPMNERRLVIPPVEKKNMLGISRYTEQAFTGEEGMNNALRAGMFGQVYGVDVFVSNNVQTATAADGSTDYYVALMFHREASVHAEQQDVRVQSQYQLNYLGNLFVADTIYGTSEYRPEAGVPVIVPQS